MEMSKVFVGVDRGGTYRVYLTISTDLAEEARRIHNTTPLATAALGRVITATGLMGLMLKEEKDKLTVIFKGDGPLEQIIAAANGKGEVKGYVNNPSAHLPLKGPGKLDVGKGIGKGELTVIKDIGLKEPQQGKIALVSGEIAEDLTLYYYVSEQQNTSVALGVMIDVDLKVKHAGGMILQMLPGGERTEAVIHLEKILADLPPLTSLIEEIPENLSEDERLEALSKRIFSSMPVEFELKKIAEGEITWKCDCSRKRLEKVVAALGEEELSDIIEKDGKAEILCNFCNEKYEFTKEELLSIYESIK